MANSARDRENTAGLVEHNAKRRGKTIRFLRIDRQSPGRKRIPRREAVAWDHVASAAAVRALRKQVRESERLLGKKTMEAGIVTDASERLDPLA